jgi:hypothetical protein
LETNINKDVILSLLEKISDKVIEPIVIVIETGHLTLPYDFNLDGWAKKNVEFSEYIIKAIVRKYKRKVRVEPVILINDLGYMHCNNTDIESVLNHIFDKNIFINIKSATIISERNIRNKAAKSLKQNNNIEVSNGRAFIANEVCDVPIANINSSNNLIPRCSSIMNSFVELSVKLGKNRFPFCESHVIFLSFAESEREYYQTKFGIDIYRAYNKTEKLAFVLAHWQPEKLYAIESIGFNKEEWVENERDY